MPKSNGASSNGEVDVFDVFASAETTTVYLDPGKRLWVRLLNELDYGQANELENAALRGIEVRAVREAVAQKQMLITDLNQQRTLKLALYIDDWSLPARWPSKLDERVGLIKRLKPAFAAQITEQIERLEQQATEQLPKSEDESDPNVLSLPSRAVSGEAPST